MGFPQQWRCYEPLNGFRKMHLFLESGARDPWTVKSVCNARGITISRSSARRMKRVCENCAGRARNLGIRVPGDPVFYIRRKTR